MSGCFGGKKRWQRGGGGEPYRSSWWWARQSEQRSQLHRWTPSHSRRLSFSGCRRSAISRGGDVSNITQIRLGRVPCSGARGDDSCHCINALWRPVSPARASGSRQTGTAWWRSAGRRWTSSGSCASQSGTPRKQSGPFGSSHSQRWWFGGLFHSWLD